MFVPEENLLGEDHKGFYLIMANFQWERLLMALGAVGAMQVAFDKTLRFALERRPSAATIGHFQAIRHKLAEVAPRSKPAATSPTRRCAATSPARTPCAR